MDQCRFCWMCRHICPIGNATGQERDTARARGMILALVARDGVEYSSDIVDNVYECAYCGACVKECVTGWDPVAFTKDARLVAALEGKLPAYVEKMLDNIDKTGNAYGEEKTDASLADEIKKHSAKTDTLLFVGKEAAYRSGANAANAAKLLDKAGVSFTMLADEPTSAYDLEFLIGAAEETRQAAMKAAKAANDFKTVICYTPEDAMMFVREYKEWGIDVKAEVKTFTAFVAQLIKDGALKTAKTDNVYTFQDPVHLARDLEETEAAREIIASCGENREMLLNRKDTMLGGNLIMNEYMPDVMKKVALDRWTNARNMGAKVVVTACPGDYEIMKSVKPDDIEIKTIEEILL